MYAQGQVNMAGGGLAGAIGGSAVAQVMAQNEAARKPELATQLDRLEQALAFAHESVERLRDRLDNGALRPDAPVTTGEAKLASACPSSGYASNVYGMVDRMGMLSEKVLNLVCRLEV